jgi:hypothetical protein
LPSSAVNIWLTKAFADILGTQLILEKNDRPAAGSDPLALAQHYEVFGTGLDVSI